MKLATTTKTVVDTLRLNKRQHESLLLQLGRRAAPFGGQEGRAKGREMYQVEPGVILELLQPGGTSSALLVKPRDLSAEGIGFVHGAFVYTGSHCSVLLKRRDGRLVRVAGKVVRCCHLHGRLHEIGVRFGETLDLSEYVLDTAAVQTSVGENLSK